MEAQAATASDDLLANPRDSWHRRAVHKHADGHSSQVSVPP